MAQTISREEELDSILVELMASRRIIDTTRGPHWIIYPMASDKMYGKFLYQKHLKQYMADGIPTVEQTLEMHKKLGLWDELKESQLKKLPDFIEEAQSKIDSENNRARKLKFKKWLVRLQSMQLELLGARNQLLANTAEYLANYATTLYFVYSCIRHMDGTSLWESFEKAQSSEDITFINELLALYTDMTIERGEKDIRELARNGSWRVRWNIGKKRSETLFGRPLVDLTSDQFMLTYWSQVYDSVYESMERPPDSIVDDDEALDDWLGAENEKREREIGQQFYGKGSSKRGNNKIDKSPEVYKMVDGAFDDDGVFVPFSHEERWEEIDKIRKLNSPAARKIRAREEEVLRNQSGQFMEEKELRRGRNAREAMGGTQTYIRKDR